MAALRAVSSVVSHVKCRPHTLSTPRPPAAKVVATGQKPKNPQNLQNPHEFQATGRSIPVP